MGTATGPVYLRVLEDLRAQIRDGVLGPGARVPSRNGIIARYGVGETAAKHALAVLAAEGLIETRAGSGSYVRSAPAARHLEHDRLHFPGSPFGLAESRLPEAGLVRSTEQPAVPAGDLTSPVVTWKHQTEQVQAPRQVARRLGLSGNDSVIRTTYLLAADGNPVQLATSFEPVALTAHTQVQFPEEGPFAGRGVIERMQAIGVLVDGVVEEISVRPCSREEAALLGISPGAAALVVDREHRAGSRAVETAEIVIPAERFRLRYRIPVLGASDARPSAAAQARGHEAGGSERLVPV
jgi:DNA-binding GntR family transcriptional regulator